ncbi:MAG TPA: hypothetical protein VM513_30915 [Kofleriaceae bacterium]|nr:hypothetical protein [Kofleriaceae bacterium]
MSMLRVTPVLLLAACANAGGSSPPVDSRSIDAPRIDAQILVDAPVDGLPSDAPVLVDAPPADAPPGSNLFCSTNGDCTIAGECCFAIEGTGFCVQGTPIGSVCLPDF